MIIADTNIVSEFMKDSPDPSVLAWADLLPPTAVSICVVTVEEIDAAYAAAASGPLAGVLAYSSDPIVSSDIVGNPASCVYDAPLTTVRGRTVKVLGWYDNEWGFTNRLLDTAELIARAG